MSHSSDHPSEERAINQLKAHGKKLQHIERSAKQLREEEDRLAGELISQTNQLTACLNNLDLSPEERTDIKRLLAETSAPSILPQPRSLESFVEQQIAFCSENSLKILDEKVFKEINKPASSIPPWDGWDYLITGLAGVVGALIDFFVVRIPSTRTLTSGLQKLITVDSNNVLAKWFKVPFDQVYQAGLNPIDHRLHSLGHDPFLGLIFGTLDIIRGGTTGIAADGSLILTSGTSFTSHPLLAPVIWLGHLLSDVATKMSLPVPGWGLTQLMQFPVGGSQQTVAKIARSMFINGYNLRHLLTLTTPVAAVEIIVRTYDYYRNLRNDSLERQSLYSDDAEYVIEKRVRQAKLSSMLFWAHATATSANAGKVALSGGNPLAINIVQWSRFFYGLAKYLKVKFRDMNVERILRNRRAIEEKWKELEQEPEDVFARSGSILNLSDLPLTTLSTKIGK